MVTPITGNMKGRDPGGRTFSQSLPFQDVDELTGYPVRRAGLRKSRPFRP